MQNVLDKIKEIQNEANELDAPTIEVNQYTSSDSVGKISVCVSFYDSIGDVTDRRNFVTTFSSDDIQPITEKKLALLRENVRHAKYVRTLITDLAETE